VARHLDIRAVTYIDDVAGKIRTAVPPGDLPHAGTEMLFRSYAVLLLAKGESVTRADVHNAWVAWMALRDPDHESLVPYEELEEDTAAADQSYVNAIRQVARELPVDGHIDDHLFPDGLPTSETELARLLELYKIMVASSEALVARRQGVNTFFLTINGAVLTAIGLVLSSESDRRLQAAGVGTLAITGAILGVAWRSLIRSAGQLNTGKFAVINRIEKILNAAIFWAEWQALEAGKNPRKYRTFSSREVWTPWAFCAVYVIAALGAVLITFGYWTPQ
jgi:hypothetical protein